MNETTLQPPAAMRVDPDRVEQVRPGRGGPLHDVGSAATTDAVRLHVEDSGGTGRPVALSHGRPPSAQAWEPQVAALREAGFRVAAYDRRGFGRSDEPKSGCDYDTLADDLQREMRQCELQKGPQPDSPMSQLRFALQTASMCTSHVASASVTTPTLIGSGITSPRTTDCASRSDGPAVAGGGDVTHSDDAEDSDLSVAGEEDRGAALDMTGPKTSEPGARWCPWPREACA